MSAADKRLAERELLKKAIAFAMEKHAGQVRRKSGLPYITHPIAVYATVKKFKESKNANHIQIASILHDVVEDCGVTIAVIKDMFGPMVASIVAELTNDEDEKELLGKEEYMNRKLLSLSSYGLVIKLADIIDNFSDSPVGPLAERLVRNITHLVNNRELSRTHQKLVNEFRALMQEYGYALDGTYLLS